MAAETGLQWVFDGVPASGARVGGDPSAFVFDASIEVFTREILQNSGDQAAGSHPVEVDFRLEDLTGARATSFRDALHWPELQAHLEGVRQSAGPTERRRFQRPEAEDGRLYVLWIEDRNTTGLIGPESGSGTFAALCRDRLFSEKQSGGSGGSFGLGKAVLWRFSAWSTVVFYSMPQDVRLSRFIAKAALPWHRTRDREYAGDGWLGQPERVHSGERAVSLRGAPADGMASQLGREAWEAGTGTRIGVVGFHDPAGDEVEVGELIARISAAAERNFWPAMAMERLRVTVHPTIANRPATPWRDVWQKYRSKEDTAGLQEEGDVVVEAIVVQLPGRLGGEGAVDVQLDLVVRLSNSETPDAFDLVAFRGAGMIVERRQRERLSGSTRPFHAMLVGGNARRDADARDHIVEQFLRDAEPPSHDRWMSTPQLRQGWRRGYAAAVESIWKRAEERLRVLVSTPIGQQDDGPDELRQLFPLTGEGGGRSESSFRFRDLRAELVEGRWRFAGTVQPAEPTTPAWEVVVTARVPDELSTQIAIEHFEADGGMAEVENKRGRIRAAEGTSHVSFTGTTTAEFLIDPSRSSFELVVTGGEVAR